MQKERDSTPSVDKKPDIRKWPGVGSANKNLRRAPNMSFSVAGLYYNCIHTRPCTYHTCMGPIIPYTSGNTEDNTQHSLGPISEPFFSQNVLAGHTQRKLWFHKYLVQIFRLAHASLGGYTLLPVVENVCFEIRICEGVCYLGCCTRTGH